MAIDSLDTLSRVLREHKLLDAVQLRELAGALRGRFTEPKALARELARRGWLTAYQIKEIFAGRGHALTLGPYLLLDRLGEGGLGVVYKARHRMLNRLVALKVVRPDLLADAQALARFHTAVEAAARLTHPNLVVAYDADAIGGTHFFAMEYVNGRDLARVVRDDGPLPVDRACELIRQAAAGLQDAFSRGMVHLDLKPTNLLLGRDRTAAAPEPPPLLKIADLGLGRLGRAQGDQGAAAYLAPEQARDPAAGDIRSDLYSLGAVFYLLLTGRPPSRADGHAAHGSDEPLPVTHWRPDVPPAVAAVVGCLLASDPGERYQTPADLGGGLAGAYAPPEPAAWPDLEVAEAESIIFNPPPPKTSGDTRRLGARGEAADTAPSLQLPAVPDSRRRLRFYLAGGGVLAAVLGVLVVLLIYQAVHKPPPPPIGGPPVPAEEAESAWEALRVRLDDAGLDSDALRRQLIAFRCRFPGTPQAREATERLGRAPSPLDRLDPAALGPADRFPWQPPELVAVLGDARWRHWAPVRAVAVSSDGDQIASAGDDRTIYVREVSSGATRAVLTGHAQPILALAFTHDGRSLASGSADGSVIVWDLATGKERLRPPAHKGPVGALAFSSDDKTLASGGEDKAVRLLDLANSKERATLPEFAGPVRSLGFAADGLRLVTAGPLDATRLWDPTTGKALAALPDEVGKATSVAFSPDGRSLAVALTAGGVKVWDFAAAKALGPLVNAQGPVAFAADGKTLFTGDGGGWLRLFDPGAIQERQTLSVSPRGGSLLALAASPVVNRWAIGNDQGEVRVWDAGGERAAPAERWTTGAYFQFSAEGTRLFSSSFEPAGKNWDAVTRKETPLLPGQPAPRTIAVSPDGQSLALADDVLIQLWDLPGAKERGRPLRRHKGPAPCITFGPDAQFLASGGKDGLAVLWDVPANRETATLRAFSEGVTAVAFSPDGKKLAIGGRDKTIKLWDLSTSRRLSTALDGVPCPVTALAFSPGGQTLVVAGEDGKLRQLDMATGKVAKELADGAQVAQFLLMTPDGGQVITASADGRMLFWDLGAGRLARQWTFPGPVVGLTLSVDGRYLATANANGTATIFRLRSLAKPG